MATTANTTNVEIGAGSSSIEKEIFSEYKPAQFTVGGRSFAFAVTKIDEIGANRLIERERPYRDGAKLDDTGSKATRWTLEAIFENSIEDEGLNTINGGKLLYPDVLNQLIDLFKVHETGDLVVPTVGKRRARAESYRRTEAADQRDCALVSFVFTEDNEDSVNASSIQAPTANANARRLGETTTFSAQTMGSWSQALSQLNVFMYQLEGLVTSPIDSVQRIRQGARQVGMHAVRVTQTFSRPDRAGRNLMLDPSNGHLERKLAQQVEIAARAANEARRGRPKLVQLVFRETTSLFRISIVVNQAFEDLLSVNPDVDPFLIPAGTVVNVFASEELLNGAAA